MASLTGQNISASYEQLLSLPDGGGNSTSQVAITDGDGGTEFSLTLATTSIAIAATHNLYLDGGGNSYLSESAGDRIDIVSGGNTVLSAEGTNKFVGINDTAPEYELDVNDTSGACTIAITAGGTAQASYLRYINSTNHWRLGSATGSTFTLYDSTNSKTPITINAAAPNHSLYVTAAGKIGMGTSSPGGSLEIRNENASASTLAKAEYNLLLRNDGAENTEVVGLGFQPRGDDASLKGSLVFKGNGTGYARGELQFLLENSTDSSDVAVDTDCKLVIKPSGRVGIGTTSPDGTLHLQSTSENTPNLYIETHHALGGTPPDDQGGNITFRLKDSDDNGTPIFMAAGRVLGDVIGSGWDGTDDDYNTAGFIRFMADSDSGTWTNNGPHGEIRFFTANGTTTSYSRMAIKADGKVGIGVTAPTTSLQVVGSFTTGLVTIAATDAITAAEHAGRINLLGEVGGNALVTLTLPDATGTGNVYKFVVSVVNTSSYKFVCPDADNTIKGMIMILDNDTIVPNVYHTVATTDTIILNGTTTGGGNIGDYIELIDIATNQWAVNGMVTCPAGSDDATMFSATVS